MDLGLNGKVALVLGASRGLGLASAKALAAEGAKVMIASSNRDNASAALADLRAAGHAEADATLADVRLESHADAAVKATVERFGALDILVNNAGGPPFGRFDQFSDKHWQEAFELSFLSAVRFSRAALPYLRRSGQGRIINVISFSVRNAVEGSLLSTSMRMGVVGFSKLLSREVGEDGVTVNNVASGMILTDRIRESRLKAMLEKGMTEEQALRELAGEVPLRRLGRPDEFGSVVAFLASERASYVNGATLQVDGGLGLGLL